MKKSLLLIQPRRMHRLNTPSQALARPGRSHRNQPGRLLPQWLGTSKADSHPLYGSILVPLSERFFLARARRRGALQGNHPIASHSICACLGLVLIPKRRDAMLGRPDARHARSSCSQPPSQLELSALELSTHSSPVQSSATGAPAAAAPGFGPLSARASRVGGRPHSNRTQHSRGTGGTTEIPGQTRWRRAKEQPSQGVEENPPPARLGGGSR